MRGRRLWLGALLLGWLACGETLLTIEVAEEATTVVEQGTLLEQLIGDLGFDAFLDMDITTAQELQNQGVAPEDIQEVYLTGLELEAIDPPDADLAFLDSMDVYVEAPDLDRVRIASRASFPDGEAFVSFDIVAGVDLHDYVVSESMTLTTEITGHRPDEETTVEGRFTLDVEVTGTGVCHALQASTEE